MQAQITKTIPRSLNHLVIASLMGEGEIYTDKNIP